MQREKEVKFVLLHHVREWRQHTNFFDGRVGCKPLIVVDVNENCRIKCELVASLVSGFVTFKVKKTTRDVIDVVNAHMPNGRRTKNKQ
jgi:hypothetical protein